MCAIHTYIHTYILTHTPLPSSSCLSLPLVKMEHSGNETNVNNPHELTPSSETPKVRKPNHGDQQKGNPNFSDCTKSVDSSSDGSDVMDDTDKKKRGRGKSMSKNLMSERKRRKKLNERLYSLRALVPNISKVLSSMHVCVKGYCVCV